MANAVDFDGTNDWLTRGADLTGAADGNTGIISFWFRIDGSDATNIVLFDAIGSRQRSFREAGNSWEIIIKKTGSSTILFADSNSASITSSANWHHIIYAWDVSVPTCQFYIDDVDEPVTTCLSDPPADGSATNWFIGTNNTEALPWDGCMAEFYYTQTGTLDLDIVANRRLFNDGTGGSAGGKPVNLGSDGSTPTSTVPIIYLNGDNANFQTNQGSGGNFVVTGALSACSTSPSD